MAYPFGQIRGWSRAEYDRLIAEGAFDGGGPVELLGGELVAREPQGSYHFTTLALAAHALARIFGPGWTVRQQAPITLDDESEPEPDLAVVQGEPIDFLDGHPARPALVVEVAETSLEFDRDLKGGLYARAGLPEYWIINLRARCLEVHRTPGPDPTRPTGWRYHEIAVLVTADRVTPLALGAQSIAVADLLPPPTRPPARPSG
ncbi:MAG: Uma2 family endonuclease [Candidatus Rokuibacteriota bacterium]